MFYAVGFERVGVVMGDLYFLDPDPLPGQEGAERPSPRRPAQTPRHRTWCRLSRPAGAEHQD
jgi:hypothetical protein